MVSQYLMEEPIDEELHRYFNTISHLLEKQYIQLESSVDEWYSDLLARIEDIHLHTLIEQNTSHERPTLTIWLPMQWLGLLF